MGLGAFVKFWLQNCINKMECTLGKKKILMIHTWMCPRPRSDHDQLYWHSPCAYIIQSEEKTIVQLGNVTTIIHLWFTSN